MVQQSVCKTIKALLELEGCTDGLPVLFICCVGVVLSNNNYLGLLGSGGGSDLLNGLFWPTDFGGLDFLEYCRHWPRLNMWNQKVADY